MKAVVQTQYGGPETLHLVKVLKPSFNDDEFLVKVHATNIASGDMRVNTLSVNAFLKPIMRLVFGFKGPRSKIRGISASGEIVGLGKNITEYKLKDKIYFINSMKAGCLAEYIVLNKKSITALKPENISYTEAAPIAFGAMSAYHFINQKNIKEGQEVLIYGASGSVGSYAIQLAKYYGAVVTAVSSEKNHEKLLALGADCVIDYHKNDFRTINKQYDVIFDAVLKISKKSCKAVLKQGGKYLSVISPTKESKERLKELNEIINKGKLVTLIDTVYPFKDFREAHKHTYTGHKVGNVVVEIIES